MSNVETQRVLVTILEALIEIKQGSDVVINGKGRGSWFLPS